MSFDWLRKRLKEQIENGSLNGSYTAPDLSLANPNPVDTYNPPEVDVPDVQEPETPPASTPAITPAVNIPTSTTNTTSNQTKVDPKTGANGAKAMEDIAVTNPKYAESGIANDDLIDAYNAGLNGEDMSRETRDNAAAGGYLEQLEAMYNAGLQDAKPVDGVAKTPSVNNAKVNIPSINPTATENNSQNGIDNKGNLNYTSGNTTGVINATTGFGPEYTDTVEHYGAPKSTKTTADLEKDLEYIKDMMYMNGAINSTDSTIQNVYRKITDLNYDASKEKSIDEIYKAFYNLMKGVTNDQIARSNKIAVGKNKNSLFDEIYDKTATSPKFNNTKDTEENIDVGQAGRYVLGEISKSSPEVFVNNRSALSEAYKNGMDGKALSPDTKKIATEGGYLNEILNMFQAGEADAKMALPPSAMYRPVDAPFEERNYPFYEEDGALKGAFHGGVDMTVPEKTKVHSAFDGIVIDTGNLGSSSYGKYIVVECVVNGVKYRVWYGHLSDNESYAKIGDKVIAGDVIGLSGSTGHVYGPHLHFEIRRYPYRQYDKIISSGNNKRGNIKHDYTIYPGMFFPKNP